MRPGRTCGTLGRRRGQLITAATASVQRIRDFLSVAWPTVTEACAARVQLVEDGAAHLPHLQVP